MKKALSKTCFLLPLLLTGLAGPARGGTDLKAHLESVSSKEAWVDVEASVGEGRLKLDFLGPWSRGSLIYDRETSRLTVVDDIRRTVFPLTQDNQTALKFVAAIASRKFQGDLAAAAPNTRKVYALVNDNARSFFNGAPVLREKGVRKGGYVCDGYRTDLDGKKAREVWVTPVEKTGMGREDFDTFRSLVHLAVELCGDGLSQMGADTVAFQQGLSDPQLPVLAVLYVNGKTSGRFQLVSVRSRSFGPGAFDPPSSYQVLSLLDMIKQGFNRD